MDEHNQNPASPESGYESYFSILDEMQRSLSAESAEAEADAPTEMTAASEPETVDAAAPTAEPIWEMAGVAAPEGSNFAAAPDADYMSAVTQPLPEMPAFLAQNSGAARADEPDFGEPSMSDFDEISPILTVAQDEHQTANDDANDFFDEMPTSFAFGETAQFSANDASLAPPDEMEENSFAVAREESFAPVQADSPGEEFHAAAESFAASENQENFAVAENVEAHAGEMSASDDSFAGDEFVSQAFGATEDASATDADFALSSFAAEIEPPAAPEFDDEMSFEEPASVSLFDSATFESVAAPEPDAPEFFESVDNFEFEEPASAVAFAAPEMDAAVAEPEIHMSFDTPEAETSFDRPAAEMSFDEPQAEAAFDAPEAGMSFDSVTAEHSFEESQTETAFADDESEMSFEMPDVPRLEMTFAGAMDAPPIEPEFDAPEMSAVETAFDAPKVAEAETAVEMSETIESDDFAAPQTADDFEMPQSFVAEANDFSMSMPQPEFVDEAAMTTESAAMPVSDEFAAPVAEDSIDAPAMETADEVLNLTAMDDADVSDSGDIEPSFEDGFLSTQLEMPDAPPVNPFSANGNGHAANLAGLEERQNFDSAAAAEELSLDNSDKMPDDFAAAAEDAPEMEFEMPEMDFNSSVMNFAAPEADAAPPVFEELDAPELFVAPPIEESFAPIVEPIAPVEIMADEPAKNFVEDFAENFDTETVDEEAKFDAPAPEFIEPLAPLASVAEMLADVQAQSIVDSPLNERYIVFKLDEAFYAVPAANVAEIGQTLPVTPLPFVPSWFLGISNLRGDILSIVGLREFWGRADGSSHQRRAKMLVVRSNKQDLKIGLLVDAIREMRRCSPADIASAAASAEPHFAPYQIGKVDYDGQNLWLLDAERLLENLK